MFVAKVLVPCKVLVSFGVNLILCRGTDRRRLPSVHRCGKVIATYYDWSMRSDVQLHKKQTRFVDGTCAAFPRSRRSWSMRVSSECKTAGKNAGCDERRDEEVDGTNVFLRHTHEYEGKFLHDGGVEGCPAGYRHLARRGQLVCLR